MLRQALSSSARALSSAPRRVAASNAFSPAQLRSPQLLSISRATRPAAARWYSDGKEGATEGEEKKEGEQSQGQDEVDGQSELKKALEAKDAEVREWKDKCLRTVADFRNLQDRTQREVKTARDFAIQKFAKDLVDSVDNLDRALVTVPAEKLQAPEGEKSETLQDLINLYDGLKMTERILLQTLSKHGLERVDPMGLKFDPNEHEATFMAPQPDMDNNTVFNVQQKGFKLNGRVLRAAKVGVVKNA
ncbi:hypothetical protein CDD81_3247 [Ophiocordyceps australis]|uniref:GrpE protein homolog n=1 Tax=Ophiocordyceps australis TaxID=1399860 RepID=A0A2C5YBM5_9HYPO|nr:hypothetical protein CDD81_3247 [Ophiocordyceps australis]